jgi:hypothetical protein
VFYVLIERLRGLSAKLLVAPAGKNRIRSNDGDRKPALHP